MQSRERVNRSIHFKQPDRLPMTYVFNSEFVRKYAKELNEFLKYYPSDFGPANFKVPEEGKKYPRTYKDNWGCVWQELLPGIMGEVKEPALKDWNQLKDFRVPSLPYENKENFNELKRSIEKRHNQEYYVGSPWGCEGHGFNLFERMQWLRGVETFFMDLIEYRDKVEELAEMITEDYLLKAASYLIKAGVDRFTIADDWGSQKNLLISPVMWREIFKPRYKRVIDFIHSQGKHVTFHSDGYIMEIIPDFIELGVDVLYPQFSCHSFIELAKMCKGKMCILTDVDRQHLLPYGKPSEVKEYVRDMIKTLAAPNGGLILRGSVESVTPLENVKAMYEAFWEYGKNDKQL